MSDADQSDSAAEKDTAQSGSTLGSIGRWLLVAATSLIAIVFAWQFYSTSTGGLLLLQAVALLMILALPHGPKLIRVGILLAMNVNVLSILVNASYMLKERESAPGLLEYALSICLLLALIIEVAELLRTRSQGGRIQLVFWLVLAVPMLIYVVGVPVANFLPEALKDAGEKNKALDPNWSIVNEISFRTAKFAVFALFTYVGACLGSFLNVVAYSLPRGESVGLRDSSCPKCKAKISRIDNLPIFSYVNLGGSCRNCKATIPARYLAVEVIAAMIFGSLFLYELVTGCANIPLFKHYAHTGVLWMILYPKWPVIGAYVYHALFMCGLLTLALIERDGQRLKWWHLVVPVLVMLILSAAIPAFHTIPIEEKVAFASQWKLSAVGKAIRPIVGGLAGLLVGIALGKSPLTQGWQIPAAAFAATGIVLGWQGLLQAVVVFAVMLAVGKIWTPVRNFIGSSPTTVLLAAVMAHHPCWKMIFDLW